jgi:hypothetical protein
MTKYTGANLYVKFKTTVLSGEFRSFEVSEEIDLVDQTTGDDVAKTYLTAKEDGDASFESLNQTGATGGTAEWAAVDIGAEGTLEWGPEGTASGKPKHWVNAIVKNRKRAFPYDDVIKLNAEFQYSGVVTDTVY